MSWTQLSCKALHVLGFVQLFGLGAYLVALIIPGEHPDKEIKWLLEFTERISRK
jgi:hypothetical protein